MSVERFPMRDKVCLITGANSGIGKVTAVELAKKGARVVMVSRNREKGESAQNEVREASGNDAVDLLLADFASQGRVRQLATRFKEEYERLDVLVNNAGAYFLQREVSPDGIEMTLAVNHVAPFLLTHLLLDILLASGSPEAPVRVVNVNSDAHESARASDMGDLQMTKQYKRFGFQAYGRSKLANLYFSYELAERMKDKGVTVNALHPGVVYTNIWSTTLPKPIRFLGRLGQSFGLPAEVGAKTQIYLASSPEVEKVTGKYFYKSVPVHSSPLSYDEALRKRVWDETEKMIQQ
jgi:NAD(P)-dependent dehydrogenase (short-subunit alcohol dehydrogenase family)